MLNPDESTTDNDIIQAYRLVLGREPETTAIVEDHRRNHARIQSWRDAVFNSDEFVERFVKPAAVAAMDKVLYAERTQVDHQVSGETLSLMLERIRRQWTELGETEPLWSVLSTPEFKKANLNDERIAELRQSGQREASLVSVFENRLGIPLPKGVCVELGCGVGRITRFLAERFDKVIALDISPGNLAMCEEYMRSSGAHNVETRLMSSLSDFDGLPEFDFLFSVITIQHNPPPIQKLILRALLSRIRPGGACVFQLPTHIPGYVFDAGAYLEEQAGEMEMHSLPTPVVLDELRRNRLKLIDVVPDPFIGGIGSFTFFATRD